MGSLYDSVKAENSMGNPGNPSSSTLAWQWTMHANDRNGDSIWKGGLATAADYKTSPHLKMARLGLGQGPAPEELA